VFADPFAPGVIKFHHRTFGLRCWINRKRGRRKFGTRVCASRRLRDFRDALLRPTP
jgi:hypothetical protein